MELKVETYDNNEAEAKSRISNRFIEAFQPETFQDVGFPGRIKKEIETYRYIDSMHDGRLEMYFKCFSPTQNEFDIIKDMCLRVNEYSKKRYGKGITVKAPLLSSVNAFRKIEQITGYLGGVKPAIFEIGPGNGMLGAMLHKAGYPYAATDITQAFYLEQNHLWNGLYPGQVVECVEETMSDLSSKSICHIPYWKLWQYRNRDMGVDIMMSNHALTEMHENSLRFYLEFGKSIMKSSKIRLFVAQWPGCALKHSWNTVVSAFEDTGYKMVYNKDSYYIFHLVSIPKKGKAENLLDADADTPLTKARQRIPVPAKKRYLEVKKIVPVPVKTRILGIKNAFEEQVRKQAIIARRIEATKNKLSEHIDSAEEKVTREPKVKYGEMKAFFEGVSDSYDTPDEEFVHYIGKDNL